MPRVAEPAPLARVRERLAGTGACPDVGISPDPGEVEGVGPAANACEQMPLPMPENVLWLEVGDGLVDDGALRDVVMADELAQPSSCEWVGVVV